MFIPKPLIGWAIMPFGILITLWILFRRIKPVTIGYYLILAFCWTTIAIIFDYAFIVKLLNSSEYYKSDVYIYYLLTFILPLTAGILKRNRHAA